MTLGTLSLLSLSKQRKSGQNPCQLLVWGNNLPWLHPVDCKLFCRHQLLRFSWKLPIICRGGIFSALNTATNSATNSVFVGVCGRKIFRPYKVGSRIVGRYVGVCGRKIFRPYKWVPLWIVKMVEEILCLLNKTKISPWWHETYHNARNSSLCPQNALFLHGEKVGTPTGE